MPVEIGWEFLSFKCQVDRKNKILDISFRGFFKF